ncbi:p53-like transcription factor [Lecanosticta acicola]|uniref:P53-like transcription factor n=1 Tax=Lecanosticta acicola TaxID=111012 RepID=A0AAI8Z3T8_9PEZI|nr:p53-like transcription factor [Lecanosticta acicola]
MDLSGFDPSTMTYLATQMQHPNVADGQDPFQDMLLPTDFGGGGGGDQHSAYGGYAGSDDLNLHGLHGPPIKRFAASAYEDPFSDVVSAFENPVHQETNDAEPSVDRDNKLLSFYPPSFDYTLLDYTYRRTAISLQAQLHGMFFLAESPWASAGEQNPPPSELTCYRRNLFQITGEITLPPTLRYIMTDQGEQIPIIGQELMISATESTEGNPVKIISVPWKTPANSNMPVPEDKVEREPPSIPLDLMNVPEMSTDFASFPFQWKRLQFRIATANNGRRKELQQHFVVRLKVIATLATGGKIPICEVQSGAIIVRGRSPRNFQSRKDMPLNGSGHTRKSSGLPGQSRAATVAGGERTRTEAPTSAPVKTEAPVPPMTIPPFFEGNDVIGRHDNYDWTQSNAGAQDYDLAAQPRTTPPNVTAAYPMSSPGIMRNQKQTAASSAAPINLSLVEEDSPKPGNRSTTPPEVWATKRLQIPPRPPSFTINTINSPEESADLLYEYFPLGLDDWMPPVDAVYRPHVVHHTKLPTDPRDPVQSAKMRSKRLYSADVGS